MLIISDDHGHSDYGFMGAPIVETPNLDRLAEAGAVYTHGFATASYCSPSLRTLLTGFEPLQWDRRMRAVRRRNLSSDSEPAIDFFETLPELLRQQGYESFKAGKLWDPTEAAGFGGGTRDGLVGFLSTSTLARPSIEPALAFIREPRDAPFFLWFAPMLPHVPFDAGPEYKDRYLELPLSSQHQAYYANVTRFDAKVGELLDELDATGLRDRTVIIYVADNGWDAAQEGMLVEGSRAKFSAFDLGIRTPIVIDLPGAAPLRTTELASIADVVPTVLDIADIPLPKTLAGRSLLPSVHGRPGQVRSRLNGWIPKAQQPYKAGRTTEIEEGIYFVRTPRWHYFWIPNQKVERLYDTVSDPNEERDLHTEHPSQARKLRETIWPWAKEMRRRALLGLPAEAPSAGDDPE